MNDQLREYWLRTVHSSMVAFFSNPDEAAEAALRLAILKYREATHQSGNVRPLAAAGAKP